jgi:hypothetical protein
MLGNGFATRECDLAEDATAGVLLAARHLLADGDGATDWMRQSAPPLGYWRIQPPILPEGRPATSNQSERG